MLVSPLFSMSMGHAQIGYLFMFAYVLFCGVLLAFLLCSLRRRIVSSIMSGIPDISVSFDFVFVGLSHLFTLRYAVLDHVILAYQPLFVVVLQNFLLRAFRCEAGRQRGA